MPPTVFVIRFEKYETPRYTCLLNHPERLSLWRALVIIKAVLPSVIFQRDEF